MEENTMVQPPNPKIWKAWHFAIIVAVVILAVWLGFVAGEKSGYICSTELLEEKSGTINKLNANIAENNETIESLEAQIETLKATNEEQKSQIEKFESATDVCSAGELDGDETSSSASDEVTVYITDTGERYHKEDCSSLRRSKHAITLYEAIEEGYTPCHNCNPPTE